MENDMDMFNDNRPPDTTWQVIKKFIVLIAICLVCVFCLYFSLPDNPFGFSPNVVDIWETIFSDIPDHNFTIISQTKGDYSSNVSTIYYDGSTIMGDEDPEQLIVLDRSIPDRSKISVVVPFSSEQIPLTSIGVESNFYLFVYQKLYYINLNDSIPEVQKCQLEFPENIPNVVYFQKKIYAMDTENTLYILDISEPAQPTMEHKFIKSEWSKNLKSPDMFRVTDLDVYKEYLVVSDQSRVHFFDFSIPNVPKEIGFYTLTTSFHYSISENVSIIGDRAFLFEGYKHLFDPVISEYLSIVDISNPQKPKRMVTYEWPNICTLYGSDESRVLLPYHLSLIDFTDKKHPEVIAHLGRDLNLSVNWSAIKGEDGYIYIMDGERVITVQYQE
jgi:hypothetical protein